VILVAGALALVAAFLASWLSRRFWPGAAVGLVLVAAGWAYEWIAPNEDGDKVVAIVVAGEFALFFAVGALICALGGSRVPRRLARPPRGGK
jgi:4-hydroxybenzoate polyprenyltransferase